MGLSKTLHFILNHPMNRGRPISALARFARWQVQCRLRQETVFNWIGGSKLVVRRGMTGATGNIYCGLHEYVDMQFVLDTVKPGDLFVDIGANVGSYTVLAGKVCGAFTIAVEPDPKTAKSLRRNVEINRIEERTRIIEAALGASKGHIAFTMGRDTVNRVAGPYDTETREVPLTTLDEILDGKVPKVIKIDVEGFEAEVLKGATKTLADSRLKAIISESNDEEVLRILTEAGFKLAHYDPEHRVLGEVPIHSSNNALMVRGLALVEGTESPRNL